MSKWQPIETADRPRGTVRLAIRCFGIVTRHAKGYWHEGDVDAGWATMQGKPLPFEPTHWKPADDKETP